MSRRRLLIIAAVLVAAALNVAVVVTLGLTYLTPRSLSAADAQRACRTAFQHEWNTRRAVAEASSSTQIVATVQGVDVQETWKVDGGWGVNGVIRYTLTTGLVDPVSSMIPLTCTATGPSGHPVVTVDNR